MLNKIMLIGNLGKDPDFSVIPSTGNSVAKFTIAVNRNTKKGDDWVKETEWFNIVAFSTLAERCEKYLHKGSKVYVEGRLSQRKYTDREGKERTIVEVTANEVLNLDPKAESGGTSSYAGSSSRSTSYSSSAPAAPAGDDFDPFLDSDDLP